MKDHPIIQFLSRPVLLHYMMPLIIIYLVIGTVAQKYIGLYEATQIFFAAPLIWWGELPLPGFPILIGLIFISLVCNLIFKSTWSWASSGIILAHMGAMLLILGGLFTALFSSEGYLDLAEGQSKSSYHDYHAREFVLLDAKGQTVEKLPFEDVQQGQSLSLLDGAITLDILNTCRNCEIRERASYAEDIAYHGMAAHMALFPKTLEINNEENMAGIVFNLRYHDDPEAKAAEKKATEKEAFAPTAPQESVLWDEAAKELTNVPPPIAKPAARPPVDADTSPLTETLPPRPKRLAGVHLALEDVPQLPEIIIGDEVYRLALRKEKRMLPFRIELIDFQKDVYPGTEMARGYSSRVRIQDGNILWETVISMNEPLRYKGYAFYQSSFLRTPDGEEISVLAVVRNAGRSFPYISSIVMSIGLLLHLILRRRYKAEDQRRKREAAHD